MRKEEILATLKAHGFSAVKVQGNNVEVFRNGNSIGKIGYDKNPSNFVYIENKRSSRHQFLEWIKTKNPPQLSFNF